MECIISIESNEADGQDSSVHSFFYLLGKYKFKEV